MTTEQGAPSTESGAEFRQKFEATQAENATLRGALAEVHAEKFGLTAEDLKEVPADQMATKAAEIAQQREEQRQTVLKEALEARGVTGDDLDAALASLKPEKTTGGGEQAPRPFTSTGSLGGTPPGQPETEGLFGVDRIRAGLVGKK